MSIDKQSIIPQKIMPALCLDLDHTVRYSKSGTYIENPEDIALFEGVEEKIWEYRNQGYLICGISNQGSVAFGYKTPADDTAELEAMINLFQRNPFHLIKSNYLHEEGTVEPYNHRSLLRKPEIGMLALCEVEAWNRGIIIDWDNSLLVGDMETDQQCAQKAGIYFMWADEFFGRG